MIIIIIIITYMTYSYLVLIQYDIIYAQLAGCLAGEKATDGHLSLYIYIYIYIYMYMCVYVCMYVYIYIYVCTHINTKTYIYIYIYIYVSANLCRTPAMTASSCLTCSIVQGFSGFIWRLSFWKIRLNICTVSSRNISSPTNRIKPTVHKPLSL